MIFPIESQPARLAFGEAVKPTSKANMEIQDAYEDAAIELRDPVGQSLGKPLPKGWHLRRVNRRIEIRIAFA